MGVGVLSVVAPRPWSRGPLARLFTGALLVAGLALLIGSLPACQTHRAEPYAHPSPEEEPPRPTEVEENDWPRTAPSDEILWNDERINDTLGVWIEADPMPGIVGPHMLLELEIPTMMCPNCERAVTRLAESIPRTRVVAINHETDLVNLVVPVAASSRVVRVLSTNGWRVVAADAELELEPQAGPLQMIEPEHPGDDYDQE